MNLRCVMPCFALCLLGLTPVIQAHADTVDYSGTFAADNSVFSDDLSVASSQIYTFTTTSYASGGIVPVLSLFNATTGKIVDASGADTGFSDVSITDTLSAGSYILDLTEFPNVAKGNLAAGFLFANNPAITGKNCGVKGGMFYNDITCTETDGDYGLTVSNSAAVTPEPATWLLVLPPAAFLLATRRRRQA